MSLSRPLLFGLISVVLTGSVILALVPQSLAAEGDREILLAEREKHREQIHLRRRSIALNRLAALPPCGSGTQGQRFVKSKDGNSVCDNNSGLWWQQAPGIIGTTRSACDEQSYCSWSESTDYCKNLTLSGKTWRLPTVEEMQWNSLVDYSAANQANALNEPNGPFREVQPGAYYSASQLALKAIDEAWAVEFERGVVDTAALVHERVRAWCVSGGQGGGAGPTLSPVTQAAARDRDELGEERFAEREALKEQIHQRRRSIALNRLAALPPCGSRTLGQRFVKSKDGNSVCDNNTGLWWQQSPSTDSFTWEKAIVHCSNLTLSGKRWRLPTVEEMQWNSLIDYSVPNQGDALSEPKGPFKNVTGDLYYSGLEVEGMSGSAWVVGFFVGKVDTRTLDTGDISAWCVSGGQDAQ